MIIYLGNGQNPLPPPKKNKLKLSYLMCLYLYWVFKVIFATKCKLSITVAHCKPVILIIPCQLCHRDWGGTK